MRRLLSGLLGVAVLAAAATPAFAGEGDRDVETRGGGEGEELGYQDAIDGAVEDVQAFWSEALADLYGQEYVEVPVFGLTSDTDESDLPEVCGETAGYEDVQGNAFAATCPDGEQVVVYDDEELFPQLFADFGPLALVLVMAHEWGHVIQGQHFTFESFVAAPSIQTELMADCFAGAYLAYVDAGDSDVFVTDPGDLETGLAGMLEVADPPGTDPLQDGAHGSGFDRANAFSEGFEQGEGRCAEYEDLSLLPPVTEIPFVPLSDDELNMGNLPIDDAIEFGIEDLDLYWATVFEISDIPYDGIEEGVESFDPRRKRTMPECEGLDLDPKKPRDYEGAVFYCPGEEFIAYDENIIEDAHAEIGDFAAMILIARAWAMGMQEDLDLTGGESQIDCFAGSYAGSIPIDFDADGVNDVSANGGPLVRDFDNELAAIALSPGDLDEVVQAFLVFSEPATGDPDELTAYSRLAVFRQGFYEGEEVCAAITE